MPPLTTRRTALGLAGWSALGGLLAGCGASGAATGGSGGSGGSGEADAAPVSGASLEEIRRRGVLRVGMEGTFRPYGFHDSSGRLVGFEKEIADLLAQDLGVRAEYVETQWDSLIAGVGAGRYDVVVNNIAATAKRTKQFDFSIPYAESRGKVAVAKDSPLTSVQEVRGRSAAQTETSNVGQQMAAAGARLVPVTGFDEAAMLVAYGRVDMTGNDFVTFQSFFEQRPDVNLRLLEGDLGEPSPASVLLGKGQTALRSAVDASLKHRMDQGDLRRIYQKYVGTDLTPAHHGS